jgi:hypothetical protein
MSTLNKRALLIGASLAVALLCVAAANAELIYPLNPSFESPVVTASPWYITPATLTNWTSSGSSGSANRLTRNNCTVVGPHSGYTDYQWNAMYGAKGGYWDVSQVLANTIQANTSYQLLTDMDSDTAGWNMGPNATLIMTLYAYSAGVSTVIGTSTIAGTTIDATNGVFTAYSTPDTVPDVSLVGQQLRVLLHLNIPNLTQPNPGSGVNVDNVRIGATGVPEPATLSLLASGLIGLVCYGWRKRR